MSLVCWLINLTLNILHANIIPDIQHAKGKLDYYLILNTKHAKGMYLQGGFKILNFATSEKQGDAVDNE